MLRLDRGPDSPLGGPSGAVEVIPSDGPISPPLDSLIGGRLALFANQWDASISDSWVRNTIRFGLSLEFRSSPPQFFICCPMSHNRIKRAQVDLAIQHLLAIKAIQAVPRAQHSQGFYSRLFLVQKSSGGWRAILDLKSLNRHIVYRRFKMQSLHTILLCIRQGDFLATIDLTEAYFHVPICPAHRKFLHFCYNGKHYQYRALPFGLSSAPRVFTKIMAALIGHIQSLPVRIMFYLDDILLLSQSEDQAQCDILCALQNLRGHGFLVNWAKSQLTPCTCIQHLGAVIDTVQSKVFLTQDRQSSIIDLASRFQSQRSASLLGLSRLLGKMVSSFGIIPWSRLHSRELQWLLLPFQRACRSTSATRIQLPPAVLDSLDWWTSDAITKGCNFREPHRLVLTTDASLYRWGTHLGPHLAQGQWSQQD